MQVIRGTPVGVFRSSFVPGRPYCRADADLGGTMHDVSWSGRGSCLREFQHLDVTCGCGSCSDSPPQSEPTLYRQVTAALLVRGDLEAYLGSPSARPLPAEQLHGYRERLAGVEAWLGRELDLSRAELAAFAELSQTLDVQDAYRALRRSRADDA